MDCCLFCNCCPILNWLRRNTRNKNPQLVAQHKQICCVTSCEFDEKRATNPECVAQSRPALFFSQQLSSTRNKYYCCATSWSRKVKNAKHRPKTCNETMLRDKSRFFCISYFAALRNEELKCYWHFSSQSFRFSDILCERQL